LSIRDPRPEKPGELPVQTRAKYELVINLKAQLDAIIAQGIQGSLDPAALDAQIIQ